MPQFPSCQQLEPNIVVHWTTDDNANLVVAVDADGWLGWFAIGVSEAGPKGADWTVVIRGAQAQTWVIGDYFVLDGVSAPTYDLEQNVAVRGWRGRVVRVLWEWNGIQDGFRAVEGRLSLLTALAGAACSVHARLSACSRERCMHDGMRVAVGLRVPRSAQHLLADKGMWLGWGGAPAVCARPWRVIAVRGLTWLPPSTVHSPQLLTSPTMDQTNRTLATYTRKLDSCDVEVRGLCVCVWVCDGAWACWWGGGRLGRGLS